LTSIPAVEKWFPSACFESATVIYRQYTY